MNKIVPRDLDAIISYLDDVLHAREFENSEPGSNGLLVRNGTSVSTVASAVNTSFVTIRGAADAGAELLLVHHTSWPEIDLHLHEAKVQLLQELGTSLYGAHASLDAVTHIGNSWVLAAELGLTVLPGQEERKLAPLLVTCSGSFPEFVGRVSDLLGCSVEAHQHSEAFGCVGIVTGAGGHTGYMNNALSRGADTFLTGEGSMYTRMFARESGLNLVMATHHATETPGIRHLGRMVSQEFGVTCTFIPDSEDVY